MNTYHLEVIGSNWPTRQVRAEIIRQESGRVVFYDSTGSLLSSYPSDKTIVHEIEYNSDEI